MNCKLYLLLFTILLLFHSKDVISANHYTTPKISDNVLATGYKGFVVTAEIETSYIDRYCSWHYGGQFDGDYWVNRWNAKSCHPRNGINESIKCGTLIKDGTKYISSDLILKNPVTSSLRIFIICSLGGSHYFFTVPRIVVKDCPSELSNHVIVMSENSVYNSTGVFKCSNNGQLFYSNGSLVISNQTFCSFTATWNGQEDLQCWTAPKPTLIGLTGISGTNLTISCEYEDVIPVGTGSIIFYGNRTIRMLMGQTFNLFVQSEDDSKEIFCQAVTPYTKLFNQSGISEMKVLRVLFQSYQNNSTTCKWQVDEEGSCDVEFYANPLPQFVDLTKDGSAIKNDIVNNLWIEANYAVLYRFQRKAVSQADSGVYTLILWSPHFPNNHSIKFTINAFKKPLEQKFAALIVVCSLLGVAWMAVIIPYAFEKIRQTKGNTYEEVKFTPKKRKQKVEWTNCGS